MKKYPINVDIRISGYFIAKQTASKMEQTPSKSEPSSPHSPPSREVCSRSLPSRCPSCLAFCLLVSIGTRRLL